MNDQAEPLVLGRPTRIRYGVLAWLCSLSMITYIDRVCIKNVEKVMGADLGLSADQFAFVFSAFALAYALFEVPGGWLGDRLGPRKVLTRIVVWWSAFTALTGAVWRFSLDTGLRLPLPGEREIAVVFDAFLLLLLVRFLFGAGEAGAYPNIARALRNWFPYTRRGLTQSLPWAFARWGGGVAPVLIGLFSDWFTWRGAFALFGLMGVAWAIGFYQWFRDTPRQHKGANEAERALVESAVRDAGPAAPLSWRTMLASPTLWCLCLMYFTSNCGWCFFITWDVRYINEVLQVEGWPLRLASGAPLVAGGLACLCGGFLTDALVRRLGRRWGRTLQGSFAYFLGGSFFLLALLTHNPWLAVPALCLASFLKDFAMAASWSSCVDVGHRYSGTVSGFMNMLGNLGTVVSPPVVKALAGEGKWELALAYSGGMFLVASFCWLFINPRRVIVYAAADHDKLRAAGVIG